MLHKTQRWIHNEKQIEPRYIEFVKKSIRTEHGYHVAKGALIEEGESDSGGKVFTITTYTYTAEQMEHIIFLVRRLSEWQPTDNVMNLLKTLKEEISK